MVWSTLSPFQGEASRPWWSRWSPFQLGDGRAAISHISMSLALQHHGTMPYISWTHLNKNADFMVISETLNLLIDHQRIHGTGKMKKWTATRYNMFIYVHHSGNYPYVGNIILDKMCNYSYGLVVWNMILFSINTGNFESQLTHLRGGITMILRQSWKNPRNPHLGPGDPWRSSGLWKCVKLDMNRACDEFQSWHFYVSWGKWKSHWIPRTSNPMSRFQENPMKTPKLMWLKQQ